MKVHEGYIQSIISLQNIQPEKEVKKISSIFHILTEVRATTLRLSFPQPLWVLMIIMSQRLFTLATTRPFIPQGIPLRARDQTVVTTLIAVSYGQFHKMLFTTQCQTSLETFFELL